MHLMNIVPLAPQAEMALLQPPTERQLAEARKHSEAIIRQMNNCYQCRNDINQLI